MFLMATSAIGPGLHHADDAVHREARRGLRVCDPRVSIVIDIALQLNVWRVIGVSGLRAQELGNRVLPGLGHVLTFFVVLGGFVFNVGNVAGTGLGLDAMCGLEPEVGRCDLGLDRDRRIPVATRRRRHGSHRRRARLRDDRDDGVTSPSFPIRRWAPRCATPCRPAERSTCLSITTLVGGTVGGYITYAGAHRLLDAGRAWQCERARRSHAPRSSVCSSPA